MLMRGMTAAIMIGSMLLVLRPTATLADVPNADRDWFIQRFDEVIVPQVEQSLANPRTNDQGGIAWGTSYQLAALAEMLDATRDPKYADLFVKLAQQVADARDDRHERRDVIRDKILPAWGSTKYSGGKHYVWAVHTGMIAEPLAQFAAVVRGDKKLSAKYRQAADEFLVVAERAIAAHDDQYREGPGPDEGYLYGLWLKHHLPLNQQNAPARAWIRIDDATGKHAHRERVQRLAHFFKNRLRTTEDGAYVWDYSPPLDGPGTGFEDISHAAINADFMVLCYEHGIVFTHEDLARLEKTLLTKVIVSDDTIADNVGNTAGTNSFAAQVLRWGRLAKHSPAVCQRLVALYRAGKLEAMGTNAQGIALIVSGLSAGK
jgi:hypothetical protein